MEKRLEVSLLGPVEVVSDGHPVPIPGSSPRMVLARLALAVGLTVPADDLIKTLWLDDPPPNALGNLHSYVSRLRRVVGADRLVRDQGGYRLILDPVDVDIGRGEQLVAQARTVAVADAERAAGLLEEALALWRGEPLAGLPEPMMFAPDLARLQEWRLQLLEEWFELRLRSGGGASTLPDLEAAVAAHPHRERLHLQLMQALHQVGRTADGLRVGEGLRRRLVDESGLDPSPAFSQLEERLLTNDPDLIPTRSEPTVVGRRAPGDRFVGRKAELGQLADQVSDHRVVTVVGPAGIGKTRLVLELLDRLKEPVSLVDLTQVSSSADLPGAAARALGLQAAPEGVETALAHRLSLEPGLLVLDNCEHVVAAARHLVAGLLARCPELSVLATSRRRLGVAAEHVIRLGPLTDEEQTQLFLDRAAAGRADFPDTEHARNVAADICRLVDGVPLGVELAASREAVFGLNQLRDRLANGLDVIDQGDDRSSAMTATIEWSYRLVEPAAQRLFDRLAVCRGGFPLEAAEHLNDDRGAVRLLAELVEASLVVADISVEPPRYRLLETMKHVARSHLSSDDWIEARLSHAVWMLEYAQELYQHQMEHSPEASRMLRREATNLREALGFLLEQEDWNRAGRLGALVAPAVSEDPQLDLLSQLRRLAPPSLEPDNGSSLCAVAAGAAAAIEGDTAVADRLLTVALDNLDESHPHRWIGLFFRLVAAMFAGDPTAVEADAIDLRDDEDAPVWAKATGVCCAALLALFGGDSDRAEEWMVRQGTLLDGVGKFDGFVAYTRGELAASTDPALALKMFERAYRQSDAGGNTYIREVAGVGRAAVLIRLGRTEEAVVACRDRIDNLQRLGMAPQLSTTLRLTAELLVAMDDPASAAVLLAATDVDPLAPVVMGPDAARRGEMWGSIEAALGVVAVEAIRQDVQTSGFVVAIQRARSALDNLD